jgi:hypothetical protein
MVSYRLCYPGVLGTIVARVAANQAEIILQQSRIRKERLVAIIALYRNFSKQASYNSATNDRWRAHGAWRLSARIIRYVEMNYNDVADSGVFRQVPKSLRSSETAIVKLKSTVAPASDMESGLYRTVCASHSKAKSCHQDSGSTRRRC